MGYQAGFQRSLMSSNPTGDSSTIAGLPLHRDSFCYRNEHSHSTIPKLPETTRTYCSPSNQTVVMSRSHNLDAGEDRASRGVKRQKYPLDDYLIDTNTQTCTQASLLSPISPVSSPETVDVLQNAERLVKNAQKQIMEVSFNSTLNTLDENSSSYMGQQPLDDSLLYIREMVDSKFQESNNPNRIYSRKASPNNVGSSSRTLQHDLFPVKESTRMLNKPLEISQQNSRISTGHVAEGILLENEKPFFKKAPNWFQIKPPEHINLFPISMTSNSKSRTKSSCTVPCCTMTNTAVIEINGRDNPNGTIQVQTGPQVDIRGGLTIQTIENVHISPDPSSVPIYNNIATYCFQHDPSTSTSLADSNRNHFDKHSITSSSARNLFDARKERHIQSTDYNDIHKVVHIENTHNADIIIHKDSMNPSHDTNQDKFAMQAALNNNNNNDSHINNDNVNRDEIDLIDKNVTEISKLRESPILIGNLRVQKTFRGSVDNAAESTQSKKTVGINLPPITTSGYEEFSVTDTGVESENKERDFGARRRDKEHYKIPSNTEIASSYGGQNFKQRSQMCGDECRTTSCSRKCERDVADREKQRLKEALETIANIEKLRFDIKDTGIIPAECTQFCDDRNGCRADTVNFEFEPFSGPERFKRALENLCKLSQNNRTSTIDTNSKMYQGAIDAFVKMFFDLNSQSNPVHRLYTPDQNLDNEDTTSRQNKQSMKSNGSVENVGVQTQKEEIAKPLTQVRLISETKETKYRQRPSKISNPKNNNIALNNLSTTKNSSGQSKEPNKYSKPLTRQNRQLPQDKIAHQGRAPSDLTFNEEENSLKNLELKQPCISDVDAVLKTYRESMAAICQGTEQLSQLISHHIMRNALSTSVQISSPPILNCPLDLGETNVEPRHAKDERISAKPVLNLVSYDFTKVPGQLIFTGQKNSTEQSSTQTTSSNQIQSIEVTQQKRGGSRIPQRDNPNASTDDAEFSHENNSTINECSSTLSNTDEKFSPAEFNVANDTSNYQSMSKVYQRASVDIRTQSAPEQHRNVKSVRKSGGNQFMNVQCCVADPFKAPIPIGITLDKNNARSQSSLKTPLSRYLHLENACGKDMRLRRHSNYDIHSEQTGDFDLYKCPILISGHRDNLDTSDNDSDDKLNTAESVIKTKEIELQIFGQILDAVKNSSQFMKRIVVSLFNGMEIDSVNDIVRNLEAAAVHPIIIEQFLVILKERNRDKSLFGGNLMLTNPESVSDEWRKNYNESTDLPKTSDNMNSFEHSLGFNGSMKTTNIHINKADENTAALHSGGDRITKRSDPTQQKMNLNSEIDKDCLHTINNCNSPDHKAVEETSSSGKVEREIIHDKHIVEEESKNSHDNLATSKTSFENKTLPCTIFRAPASGDVALRKSHQDCQEAEKSLEVELYQRNCAKSEEQSDTNENLTNSTSSNATPKINNSESNTDKDISFLIPHDTDMDNEVVDLSSVQKLNSVTLENETTGKIIGIQTESNCQNCLRLNSHMQERSRKMNSHSDPGQSSTATNKSSGKLHNSNYSTSNNQNLAQNFQRDDHNIICHCQRSKDHNHPSIESRYIPCDSSLDTVNALIDLQIQNNYKELGLIDSAKRPFRLIPNKMTPVNERTLNKRPSSSKSSATAKSPVRKTNDSSTDSGQKKKPFDKKVIGSKKTFRDNKQGLVKAVKNPENSDPEKFGLKNPCPLCIQLEGKCSCAGLTNHITNLKKHKKISPKLRKEKAKLIKNTISPRQSGSPKRSGHTTDKAKELSFSSQSANSKNIDDGQGIVKNNEKSNHGQTAKDVAYKAPKSKFNPGSDTMSSNSNKNDGLMNRKAKPKKGKKLFQDTASGSANFKVEDKSQNTTKSGDVTVCSSTETPNTVISGEITVCKGTKTLCKRLTILDEVSRLLPWKPDNITEIMTVDKSPVKKAATLQCSERIVMQDSSTGYGSTCSDRMNATKETVTGHKEMRDLSTLRCRPSEMCNSFQQHLPNPVETVSEAETVSALKTTGENIFNDENIIVLQPLNEMDHTFFIAKPNCVQRKLIQEKLNKGLNCQVSETTDHSYPSINECNQHHRETNKEMTCPNSEMVEQVICADKGTSKDSINLHSTSSVISCVKNKECQAGCPGGMEMEDPINNKQSVVAFAPMHVADSNVSILENKEECGAGLCTNDEECLRICAQRPAELNDSKFHCKQDCPIEEICLTLCPSVSQGEPLLQTSSININGILKKFIVENNVPDVKLPIVKGLLKELKKVEDSLRGENEKLGTILEKSESQNDEDKAEYFKPRCSAEESPRKSTKYEEPREKMKGIMSNRKSLILPNVVREIADMHPSTKLERLKLRSADPLVSGNFNKPESDRRYSVFNQIDPESSTINLNDPKTQAHLAAVAQRAKGQEQKESSSDSSADIAPSILTEMIKNTSTAGKSNSNTGSKLNKSRRGMDADSNILNRLDQRSVDHENNSMKSFESSDLEPGEFLQVRTPFDNPIMLYQSSKRTDFESGEVSQDQAKCTGLCNNGRNHSRSVINPESTNTHQITTNQYQTLENKYELCMDSAQSVNTRDKHKSNTDKFVDKSDSVSPSIVKSTANASEEIFGKNDPEIGVSNHHLICDKAEDLEYITTDDLSSNNQSTSKLKTEQNSKAEDSVSISKSNFTDVKSNTLEVMEKHARAADSQYSKMNNSQSSRVDKDYLQKYSERLPGGMECSNRPQIIDHFLGKRKLEDLKIEYTNNEADTMSKECQSLEGNSQWLYLKSDFTSKTTPDLENSNIMDSPDLSMTPESAVQFNYSSRTRNKRDFANSNKTTSKRWDQISSDTYSEGEINLPSSCSYSLGEVKISTPSSCTTVGKSFKDPDGLTIFVTKSVLDSTYATCTSPGEILADIQKTETDFSSSIS